MWEECGLRAYEKWVLRKIFEFKRKELKEIQRKLHNE
jgi:hypothetical protein